MTAIDDLREKSKEIVDFNNILALMQWDQEVKMPAKNSQARASQLASLSGIVHQKITSEQLGGIIKTAEDQQADYDDTEKALIRVMRREYDQNTKLPESFVSEFSRSTSEALQVWVEARKKSNFSLFEPYLEKIVAMCRQKADYLGYESEPYDALLDLHEEGLLTLEVTNIFASLQPELTAIVNKHQHKQQFEITIKKELPLGQQIRFSERVLEKIGYDFSRGRQDKSPHPFTTSLGHHDRRVTNRYNPHSLEFIFSALHEGGHALYEQGISEKLAETHLDSGISLGIHESQSRLWENIIGRSKEFWENFYPELQVTFPDEFNNVSVDEFVRGINRVKPGLIRVEADEVSYNLHVLIRFELEKALIQGSLSVNELPALWNEKYNAYLSVSVENNEKLDANGVLQDIHWAHGSFGYFPTYTIGNLAAAQIWNTYCEFDPSHNQTILSGDLNTIKNWLESHIYCHGAIYKPSKLLKKVTGNHLKSDFFVDYLSNKYGDI